MYRASQAELSKVEKTARVISGYYAKNHPEIGFEEFFSIAQDAICDALKEYKPKKGKLLPRIKKYIYDRFHNHIKRFYKCTYVDIPKDSLKTEKIDITFQIEEILSKAKLPLKQKQAVEYFLKYKEPPRDINGRQSFCRAIKKIRNVTK